MIRQRLPLLWLAACVFLAAGAQAQTTTDAGEWTSDLRPGPHQLGITKPSDGSAWLEVRLPSGYVLRSVLPCGDLDRDSADDFLVHGTLWRLCGVSPATEFAQIVSGRTGRILGRVRATDELALDLEPERAGRDPHALRLEYGMHSSTLAVHSPLGGEPLWQRRLMNSGCVHFIARFVGDVNGDSVEDIVAGSSPVTRDNGGAVHLVCGATGRLLWSVHGEREGGSFGLGVARMPGPRTDQNGDGTPDVVVLEHSNDAKIAPHRLHVLSGRDGTSIRAFDLDTEAFSIAAIDGVGIQLDTGVQVVSPESGEARTDLAGWESLTPGRRSGGTLTRTHAQEPETVDIARLTSRGVESIGRVPRPAQGVTAAILGDFDGDGREDVLLRLGRNAGSHGGSKGHKEGAPVIRIVTHDALMAPAAPPASGPPSQSGGR